MGGGGVAGDVERERLCDMGHAERQRGAVLQMQQARHVLVLGANGAPILHPPTPRVLDVPRGPQDLIS